MSNFMDRVGGMAKKAADKTGDMVEIGKLNAKILSQQQSISSVKEKIGELIFERYQQGEQLPDDVGELCKQIEDIQNNIASLKKEIQEIKE